MLGGVGAQLMAPLSPGFIQTSTSCSTMSCLSRPGKDLRFWGSWEKGVGRPGGGLGLLKTTAGARRSGSGTLACPWGWPQLAPGVMFLVGEGRGQLATSARHPPTLFPHNQDFLTGPPLRLGSIAEIDLGVPPPVMKTFKEFLLSLDDSVDETEAVKRYNDYKLDFRRQQMQDFFLAHKDEEW